MNLTFGSLFAGIGGFDLGFERAGMVCKWQVEIDPFCQKVLAKHWPDVRRHDDVKTFPPSDPREWAIDVICGGFPCQDISYAGKGAGLEGERSGLFYEAIRIIREVGPRIVVLENVSALLTRGLDQVLGTLDSIGFNAEWHCLSAAHFGAPHIRDRVFVLANRKGKRRGKAREHCKQPKEWASGGSEIPPHCSSTNVATSRTQADEKRQERELQLRGSRCGPRPGDYAWAPEPDVARVVHGVPNQPHRIRGLGNSIVPQVAEYIGRMIVEAAK